MAHQTRKGAETATKNARRRRPCSFLLRSADRYSDRHTCFFVLLSQFSLLVLMCQVVQAVEPLDFGFSRQSKREAINQIPFDKLNEESGARIEKVVTQPSIYRRMPVSVIQSDPDLYLFVVRHPEVIVNMWKLMGVTKVQVERTGPYSFDAQDGSGTFCRVELVYGDSNLHVFYADGHYQGPLFKNVIRGKCVMVLGSNSSESADRTNHVTTQLDIFVYLENLGAGLLAKTLHPLVGRSADHNFVESTRFLEQVPRAAVGRPAALQGLIKKLTSIDPEVRDKFALVAAETSGRAIASLERMNVDLSVLPDGSTERAAAEAESGPAVEPLLRSFRVRKPLNLRR